MTTDVITSNKIIPITLNTAIIRFSTIMNQLVISTLDHEHLMIDKGLESILILLNHCRERCGTVYIIGNGGSAAIASHAVIDFLKMAGMKAFALLDPAVTTCISNDCGYEYVYSYQVAQFIQKDDVLIAISSSGQSLNIINAVDVAKKSKAKVITLSGFSNKNPLRRIGEYNLWLNSQDYGQVEIGHAFILHYLTDRLKETVVPLSIRENLNVSD